MSYNGWATYETGIVKLWLDNGQVSHELCLDLAGGAKDGGFPVRELADAIRDYVEDGAPDLGATMYSDLLTAALGKVDWGELATSYLEESKGEEEK